MNTEKDFKRYREAAERGDVDAQKTLGDMYFNGQGVEQSDIEMVKWYKKAAVQGNKDAQCYLGWCYESGLGTEKNLKEAVNWYQKAAEQGDEKAQADLIRLRSICGEL